MPDQVRHDGIKTFYDFIIVIGRIAEEKYSSKLLGKESKHHFAQSSIFQ
jgi:hypothetical protein